MPNQAVKEWPDGGMPFPKGDANPDFAAIAKRVTVENFQETASDRPREHLEHVRSTSASTGSTSTTSGRSQEVHQGLRRTRHPSSAGDR